MELFIFNKELELIHIIDVFNSLCWRRKYYEVGEFELEIELTDDILKYLKIGNIIYKKRWSRSWVYKHYKNRLRHWRKRSC